MAWFELKLDMDGDTWLVTSPAFPEVTTFGEDTQSALVNGRMAIEEAIAARIAKGDDVPSPLMETSGKGHFIEVPLLTFLKSALYTLCRLQGISRAELSRRLGWHREQVDRLFRIDHNSQLGQLELAFKAIGSAINLSIETPAAA